MALMTLRGKAALDRPFPASFSGTEVTRTSLGPLICPRQGAEAQMIKHSAFLQQKMLQKFIGKKIFLYMGKTL